MTFMKTVICAKCKGLLIGAESGKACPVARGGCFLVQGKCMCDLEAGYYAADVNEKEGYTCRKVEYPSNGKGDQKPSTSFSGGSTDQKNGNYPPNDGKSDQNSGSSPSNTGKSDGNSDKGGSSPGADNNQDQKGGPVDGKDPSKNTNPGTGGSGGQSSTSKNTDSKNGGGENENPSSKGNGNSNSNSSPNNNNNSNGNSNPNGNNNNNVNNVNGGNSNTNQNSNSNTNNNNNQPSSINPASNTPDSNRPKNSCDIGCVTCNRAPDGSRYCSSCFGKTLATTKPNEGKCEGDLTGGCVYHGTEKNDGKAKCLICKPAMMLVTAKDSEAVSCEEMPEGYNCGQGTKKWLPEMKKWEIKCIYCKNGDKLGQDGRCELGAGTRIERCDYVYELQDTICIKCQGSLINFENMKVCPESSGMCITVDDRCFCNTELGYFAVDVNDSGSYKCKKGSEMVRALFVVVTFLLVIQHFYEDD